MSTRIAINGFGRIGRLVLRAWKESGAGDFELVAVNDLGSTEDLALLLAYDSVHGRFPGRVAADGDRLIVDGSEIRMCRDADPTALPWQELGVDIVLECSGKLRQREQAEGHLQAGAGKVLISAPAKGAGADITVVYGLNQQQLRAGHRIVSNASCTTNCIAPVASVLHELAGIEQGNLLTVHSYTGDQHSVDALHKDPRRGRAAACNMVPTTTGAASALGQVLPELAGRITGAAMRVPLPNVSITYLTAQLANPTSVDAINAAMREAAGGRLQGVLGYSDLPLVSSDFNHDPHSAIFDAGSTALSGDRLATIAAWYDNEWGFSMRMLDTARAMADAGQG